MNSNYHVVFKIYIPSDVHRAAVANNIQPIFKSIGLDDCSQTVSCRYPCWGSQVYSCSSQVQVLPEVVHSYTYAKSAL